MLISLREAASSMGCSPRTLRARLARGDVVGKKHGSQWRVESDAIPLTNEQRARLHARAETIRQTVDDQLARMVQRTKGPRRSLRDLDAPRATRSRPSSRKSSTSG